MRNDCRHEWAPRNRGICCIASITAGAIGTALLGGLASTVLGSVLGGDKGSAPAAPAIAAPTPMPVPPELDPKKKAMAEQNVLMGGMSGNTPLSRSGTILGGSGTLG